MGEQRNKKKVTLTIDPNLFDMLDDYCKTNNVFKNELISLLLLKFFDEVNFTENRKEVFYSALLPSINAKNAMESNTVKIPELFEIYQYLLMKYLTMKAKTTPISKSYIRELISDPKDDLTPREIK